VKTQITLKSLAELPANTFAFAASAPGRTMNASKQLLGPAAQATRRQIRSARRGAAAFARDLYARARAPFQGIQPWPRGGINE
jgi:hypothetical protein